MLELLLLVVALWSAVALLALPLAMRLGRAAGRADADALRQHDALHRLVA